MQKVTVKCTEAVIVVAVGTRPRVSTPVLLSKPHDALPKAAPGPLSNRECAQPEEAGPRTCACQDRL